MTLITEANFDKNMSLGLYSPLAGVSKPMLVPVQNKLISGESLKAGQGINIASGVVTLATDNATHILVGSNLLLVDGSNEFKAVEELLGTMTAVEKGLARVQCEVKAGEVIVKGDNVAFQGGVLVKKTTETQYFVVEEIDGLIAQISFK